MNLFSMSAKGHIPRKIPPPKTFLKIGSLKREKRRQRLEPSLVSGTLRSQRALLAAALSLMFLSQPFASRCFVSVRISVTRLVVSEEALLKSEGQLCAQGTRVGVPRLRNAAVFSPRCVRLEEPRPDMCL